MTNARRFLELSPARQAFVRLCQKINFGRVENLQVRDSEPLLSPPPLILVDVKLNSDEPVRPEIRLSDFALTCELCNLFKRLSEIKNGAIERIHISDGIPRRLIIRSWPLHTGEGQR